jgi:hypothetical protein
MLVAGVEQASAGVADGISRVHQLASEHSLHTSSLAGKLESQTKVGRWCQYHTLLLFTRVDCCTTQATCLTAA